MKVLLFIVVLLAFAAARKHHGPPQGGNHHGPGSGEGPHGHKWLKQRCMTTNSQNAKFDLSNLKTRYDQDPFTFTSEDLSVSFTVCGRSQKLEDCGSIGACLTMGKNNLNVGGSKKEWIDTQTSDSVSFQYLNGDFCDVIGGNRWKTIVTISYIEDNSVPLRIDSVEQGNCTVNIFAFSSQIKANQEDGPQYEDDDDGERNFHHKKMRFLAPLIGGLVFFCCCIACCCCIRRRQCNRSGATRTGCRWGRCRTSCNTNEVPASVPQVVETYPAQNSFVELESHPETTPVLNAVQPPPMYPQMPQMPGTNQPYYPSVYYYPQMNAQPVVPRESQLESDEKLAKALQEQINKGAL